MVFKKMLQITQFLQSSFRTKAEWYNINRKLEHYIETGDWNSFEKVYSLKNTHLNFNTLGCKVGINGSLSIYKKLEEKGLQDNQITNDFYINCFGWSIARDNVEIVKDVYQKGYVKFSMSEFKTMIENKSEKIINFLLYDINYQVNDDINNWLISENNQEMLERIKKRDLFFSLNKELDIRMSKKKSFKI